MNLIKITFFTVVMFFTLQGYAQTKYLKDIEEAKLISHSLAQLFKENKFKELFIKFREYYSVFEENEVNKFESETVQKVELINERFGNSEGIVKIEEQNIKDTFFKEIYLVKYQNSALRLIFRYYKNNKGWKLQAFKWDDYLEDLK